MLTGRQFSGLIRLPFLILAPACVMVGIGTALHSAGRVDPFQAALVLFGALSAHISVNAFNEYFDAKSGLDFRTVRTPFSGGSGTLPLQPDLARAALSIAWTAFALTAVVGVYLASLRGWALLLLGIPGLLLLYTYTPCLTHHPIACLIAPGLGFGPLMVISTHFVLTGQLSGTALLASLVPFFLVSNLLLLNQFPDVEADRTVGRRHFPILLGRQKSSFIYFLFLLLAFLIVVLSVLLKQLPTLSLIGLLGLGPAVPSAILTFRHAENPPALIPALGLNVLVTLFTPLLLGIGMLIR